MVAMTGTGGFPLKIRVSPAIPSGEVWFTSGCSWKATRPELPHGEPEWRSAGMCVHEHLDRRLLCAGCKELLEEFFRKVGVNCIPCGKRLAQGRHGCPLVLEFRPLGEKARWLIALLEGA